MSTDKYPSMFSLQMEAIAYIIMYVWNFVTDKWSTEFLIDLRSAGKTMIGPSYRWR